MNFLSIHKKFSEITGSKNLVLSVPYERTSSYKAGSAFGPQAIIDASAYVELFDAELEIKPHMSGIAVAEITPSNLSHEESLKAIGETYSKHVSAGKFVIALGGEHSITIGIVNELKRDFPRPFTLIQFDAHADLRSYYKNSHYSHACVARRAFESIQSLVLVGTRSYSSECWSFLKKNPEIVSVPGRDITRGSVDRVVEIILNSCRNDVYISFDVDYFSFDVISSTGTPEPGGPDWYSTLSILKKIFEEKTVIGMDIVELIGDAHEDNRSAFSAALLLKKCIAYKNFLPS